ncbi:sensor histidine kinase [Antrihabitans cavernicola]|uniref:Oxygen sensor histidine kinase NreB n=1 Tax=Antrihabitans cavernicola TaxID=2495913 RepID=A0A5A7S3Z2_9NOCA|nr:ATP-binding protein [Spelaeibacter cavernicola]KAA0020121.1 two-component sensor histidine kinase [Spelaeibacter cavernicola]
MGSTGSSEPNHNAEGAPATDFSALFTARIPDIVARYYEQLDEISSPLISGVAWEQCELQARRILDDCARSLAAGRAMVTHVTDVFDLGTERVRQGAHITHSMRAGSILSDLTMTALSECAIQVDARQSELLAAVRALHQGIGLRLESGSIGYDAFLLQRVQEAHEQGQHRLAREIHDHIGNSVSLALRRIELFELEREKAGDDSVPRHVQLAKDAILETLSRSRELVTELRRSGVGGSLETALRGFAASLGESGAPLQISVRGNDEWVPSAVVEELFIMVRECLRNAHTHAGAANIVVHIDITPREIQAEVIDDGKGFDVEALRAGGHGNGLLIMQERSDLVGGRVHIDSAPDRGTRVTFSIPITQESPTA